MGAVELTVLISIHAAPGFLVTAMISDNGCSPLNIFLYLNMTGFQKPQKQPCSHPWLLFTKNFLFGYMYFPG